MKFKVCYSFVAGDHHANEFSTEEKEVEVEAESAEEAKRMIEKDINRTVYSVELIN
jgi:hypothetical protein